MKPQILFYTCANKPYEDFAPLFIGSALAHSPESVAEVGVEDEVAFASSSAGALEVLGRHFPGSSFRVRTVPWHINGAPINPNAVRFVTTPSLSAKYVFLSDVDIIFLDAKLLLHNVEYMKATGLPFANRRRSTRPRLTGMHFTPYENYYPIPPIDDLDLSRTNDEQVLTEICRRKGFAVPEHAAVIQEQAGNIPFRRIPGYHVSPHRDPEHWKLSLDDNRPYREFATSPLMRELRSHLSERVQNILAAVDRILQRRLGVERL